MKVEKIIYVLSDKHTKPANGAEQSVKKRPCVLLHSDDEGVIVVRVFSSQKKIGEKIRLEIEYLNNCHDGRKSHIDHDVIFRSAVNKSQMIELKDLEIARNSRNLTEDDIVQITVHIERNFNKQFKKRQKVIQKIKENNKK